MAQCEYWWFAGAVEWCDLNGSSCRCSGWEDSCVLKKTPKKSNKAEHLQIASDMDEINRHTKHNRL